MTNTLSTRERNIVSGQSSIEREFWQKQLADLSEPGGFPNDQELDSEKRAVLEFSFPQDFAQSVIRLGKDGDTRIHIILLAGVILLLNKYTGKRDLTVGIPIYTQPSSQTGLINRVLPLRHHIEKEKSFKEFLRELANKVYEANRHMNYPLAQLLHGDSDIFHTAVLLRPIHNPADLEETDPEIVFDFSHMNQTIRCRLQYISGRYSRRLVEGLLVHFQFLLQQCLDRPSEPVSHLELLDVREKQSLLYDLNQNRSAWDNDKPVLNMIEDMAEKFPHRVMLVDHHRESSVTDPGQESYYTFRQTFTFGYILRKSRILAGQLIKLGVCGDYPVAIYMNRSFLLVEAILATWIAGGAYLPLSPVDPPRRTARIMADAEVGVVISDRYEVLEKFPKFFKGRILYWEKRDYPERASEIAPGPIGANNSMNHIAYIIYTSGSTGSPKGALVEHRGFANHVRAKISYLGLSRYSITAQSSPHNFDISMWQFFACPAAGGRISIFPGEMLLEPGELFTEMAKDCVTILQVVPSYLAFLLDYYEENRVIRTHLRYILAAGEELKKKLVQRWFQIFPQVKMVNAYGPSEASDDICHFIMTEPPESSRIPIGSPTDNLDIYVLNRDRELLPTGIKGEIWVAGPAVGRGYLNDPEKTIVSFTDNHLKEGGADRLYCTGDLGILQPKGILDYYGRTDNQVKIRGHRIELMEIENHLTQHPGIKEVAVIVKIEENNPLLCAYITRNPKAKEELPSYRDYLSSFLPGYMIPAHFVELDRLPLSANGKVNKKALASQEIPVENSPGNEAPMDEVEVKVGRMWAEILGNTPGENPVCVRSNFFQMGGHSLKATILLSRILRDFQVKITLGEFLKGPTVRDLSERIKTSGSEIFYSLSPVEAREYYPLSPSQKRIFLLEQMEGTGTAYNLTRLVDISGIETGIKELNAGFEFLIKRHESLRTEFRTIAGEPAQFVQPSHSVQFVPQCLYIEKGGTPSKLIKAFVRPFNLNRAPLLRVGYICDSSGKALLLIVDMHHIVSDGFSHNILTRDFLDFMKGREISPLKLQYKDFAMWQWGDEIYKRKRDQEEFWVKELSGFMQGLELPYDFRRPAVQSFQGKTLPFSLSLDREAIQQLAFNLGATVYMVLLGVFNIFLARLSSSEDVLVGTPVSGRNHTDLQDIIGMFVNTLALRNQPCGHHEVLDFLEQVKERTLLVMDNQDYPFEELVEKMALRRDASRNPLFDIMFAYQGADTREKKTWQSREKENPKLTAYESGVAKFDLTLIVIDNNKELELFFNYSTRLFKAETIERFAGYFDRLSGLIIQDPHCKISDLELLSPEERNRILWDFNDSTNDFPRDKSLVEIFEDRARTHLDHPAVVMGNDHVSYGDLSCRSDFFALKLKQQGLGTGQLAAIKMYRSIDMVVAILAVLKLGAAYLPLSADCPVRRLNFALRDCRPEILIYGPGIEPYGEEMVPNFVFEPMAREDNCSTLPKLSIGNRSHRPAYIIYTSGSTGNPKGVLVTHHSAVNTISWFSRTYEISSGSRLLMMADITFDASVNQLFGTLLAGGVLVIMPMGPRVDIHFLRRYIEDRQINLVNGVPMLHKEILLGTGRLKSLERVISGGDRLDEVTAQKIIEKGYRLYNQYGLTETTIDVLAGEYLGGIVSIGRPIANARCIILDDYGNIAPIGLPGELCVAGPGIALGYLNQPELTHERFVSINPSPWGEECSTRFFKTGDICRWLPQGEIEFLGRSDRQVKVAGYRIEPGEIENQLMTLPGVKDCAVIARENMKGEKYLCAYLAVPQRERENENALSPVLVRSDLAGKLPTYMIPWHYIFMDAIPHTPNGKVDVEALPNTLSESGTGEKDGPRTGLEEKILAAWTEVLIDENSAAAYGGAASIGVFDDFFQLGGNSLKAMQLVSRLITDFEITMTMVFQYPTVAELAGKVVTKRDNLEKRIERIRKSYTQPIEADSTLHGIHERLNKEYQSYKESLKQEVFTGLDRERHYESALITGATGFLGINLVHSWLTGSPGFLYLLVRAGRDNSALERFRKKCLFYFGPGFFDKYGDRFRVIEGDLRMRRLGIDAGLYSDLAGRVEAVIHGAANVNHFGHNQDFYLDNVQGTDELLRFAQQGKAKDFHYMSTMSVGLGAAEVGEGFLFNEFSRLKKKHTGNLYIDSKVEAEQKVLSYREKGLNTSIYRLGNLFADSRTGVFQENIQDNAFYANIKTYLSLGLVPRVAENRLDLMYIDYTADIVMRLITRRNLNNEIYHLQNINRLKPGEIRSLLGQAGFNLKEVRPGEFLDILVDKLEDKRMRPVIERFLLHQGFFDKTSRSGVTMMASDRTREILSRIGIQWPELEGEHIVKMIAHCRKVGFLD